MKYKYSARQRRHSLQSWRFLRRGEGETVDSLRIGVWSDFLGMSFSGGTTNSDVGKRECWYLGFTFSASYPAVRKYVGPVRRRELMVSKQVASVAPVQREVLSVNDTIQAKRDSMLLNLSMHPFR